MARRIEWHERAQAWVEGLDQVDATRIAPALDAMTVHGRSAGKEHVKPIKHTRHPGVMHELRSTGGNLRVLFAMERDGTAVMLLGGDKTGLWNEWYDRNVTVADRRLDEHRRRAGKEQAWQRARAGTRSVGREL